MAILPTVTHLILGHQCPPDTPIRRLHIIPEIATNIQQLRTLFAYPTTCMMMKSATTLLCQIDDSYLTDRSITDSRNCREAVVVPASGGRGAVRIVLRLRVVMLEAYLLDVLRERAGCEEIRALMEGVSTVVNSFVARHAGGNYPIWTAPPQAGPKISAFGRVRFVGRCDAIWEYPVETVQYARWEFWISAPCLVSGMTRMSVPRKVVVLIFWVLEMSFS
ncbi:hypothetical protein BDZ89DRAFT_1038427 [Hymenopellis radicata]|nr:hypothetical protein BDZ89DRAFT_1038427 [Hymenopellis radicata]